MPTAKSRTSSSSRNSSLKPPAPVPGAIAGKTKPLTKEKSAVKPVAATPRGHSGAHKKMCGISPEQRSHYVEIAAYYIAEQRGFTPEALLDDWIQAEKQIDRLLAKEHSGN